MLKTREQLDEIQELLDCGISENQISKLVGLHRRTVVKMVRDGLVEKYEPNDNYSELNEVINFEWLWEEDKLDEIANLCLSDSYIINAELTEDELEISRYCRIKYGDIVSYLSIKHNRVLAESLYKECVKCGEVLGIDNYYPAKASYGIYGSCKECEYMRVSDNIKENPLQTQIRVNRRRTFIKNLPTILSKEDWKESLSKFDNCCACCRGTYNIHLDHYIPVSWGHGGTIKENCIPLCSRCNFQKRNKQLLPSPARDRIESYLASLIGCSPEGFRCYVDWCDANRRKPDAITTDKTSFELFTEAEAEVIT